MKKILLYCFLFSLPGYSLASKKIDNCVDFHMNNDEMVVVDRCDFTAKDLPDFIKRLQQENNRPDLIIDFSNNNTGSGGIGDEGLKILASIKNIGGLYLDYNHITDNGLSYLLNTNIGMLGLNENFITPKGAEIISKIKSLRKLNICENYLGNEGVKILASSTITDLTVCNNHIEVEGAKALANDKNLTSLDICDNNISDDGFIALVSNENLTFLAANNNNIGDESMPALANNRTINMLDLGGNAVTDAGVEIFVKTTSTQFTDLYFESSYRFFDGCDMLKNRFGYALARCSIYS